MKTFIIGDLHFGNKKNTEFIDYQITEINKIIDYIFESGVKNVIILGDVFDNRQTIDINVFTKISKILNRLESLNVYVIIGNHDTYFKTSNEVNSLSSLFNKYNFNIIDKIREIEIDGVECLFVPWIHKNNYDESLSTITSSSADYCFGHFAINDFYMVRGIKESNGLKQSSFKKFKKVFSGHFHLKDEQKNIVYVGSFVQLNWNDCGDQKQIILLDSEKEDFEKIEIVDSIYENVFISGSEKFDIDIEGYKDKIIKVFLEKKLKPTELNLLDDLKAKSFSCDVIDNTMIIEKINENIETEDITKLIGEVLDSSDKIEYVYKKMIKSYIGRIYQKTLEGN